MNYTKSGILTAAVLFVVGIVFFVLSQKHSGERFAPEIKTAVKVTSEENTKTESADFYFVKTLRDIKKGEMFDRNSVEEGLFSKLGRDNDKNSKINSSSLVFGRRATKFLKKGKLLENDDVIDTGEDMR